MVEFVVDEWKKIIIHEIIKYDLDTFFKVRMAGVPPRISAKPLLWANGVVFDRTPIASTDEVVKEQLDGMLHWSSLEFAFMPSYESKIKIADSSLEIIDVSPNKTFLDMADFLKKRWTLKR
jgi:hypothetical protein